MSKKNLLERFFPFVFFTILFTGLVASCTSTDYVERDYDKNLQKLMDCQAYDEVGTGGTTGTAAFEITENIDPIQAKKIREYFKENADLDLDALAVSSKSTWEKALELTVFVAKNVPHDNQKKNS